MKEKTLKTVKVRCWKFAILLTLVGLLTAGLFYASYHEIISLIKDNSLQLTGLSKYINGFTISLFVAIILLSFLLSFYKDFSLISSHIQKMRKGDLTNQINIDKIHKNGKVYNTAREFNFMSNKLNNNIKDVVHMTNSVIHHSKTLELISKDGEINSGKLNYIAEDIQLSLEAQDEYLEDTFNELGEVYERINGLDSSLSTMRQNVDKRVKIATSGKDELNYLNREINSLAVLLEENTYRADNLKLRINEFKELVDKIGGTNEKIGLLTLIANVEDEGNKQPEANREIKMLSQKIEKSIKSIALIFENVEKDFNYLRKDVKISKETLQEQNKRFKNIGEYSYSIDEFLKYSKFNLDKDLKTLEELQIVKEDIFVSRENIYNVNVSVGEKTENISSIIKKQIENNWKTQEHSSDLFSLSKNLKKELEEFKVK